MTHLPPLAALPDRKLQLSTYLAGLHGTVQHHLCASECETMPMADLLALADPDDLERWNTLRLGYTDPRGAPWLREAAASDYRALGADDLVCFAGAQEALLAVLHALLGRDDHAIIVVPSYQSMETLALRICALTGVGLDPARAWSLDIAAIADAIRPNTRLVMISFPNNPTGKQLGHEEFHALVHLCRQRGIWLLSDEVYRLTEYDPEQRLPHAADRYERGISLGALSKAYGLPGVRVGWLACRNPWLQDRVAALRHYLSACSAGPSEVLAGIALKAAPRILSRNRGIAGANLRALMRFLARHEELFDCYRPEGGMVCYPRYKGGDGVERFVERMAQDAGVLLAPASVFRSELLDLPADRFRIGFGHADFPAGLEAFERALS